LVTSKFKYGDLDLSVIASKEEGQKNTMSYVGQSQADSVVFRSRDYAPRTMYFLADPTSLYELYSEADIGNNPMGWIDNAVKTASDGSWIIKNVGLLPEYGSMNLYYDDASHTTNDQPLAVGDTIWVNSYTSYIPHYENTRGRHGFITDYDAGFITVMKTLIVRPLWLLYTNAAMAAWFTPRIMKRSMKSLITR
jgi:hypothetical protein